MIGYTAGTVGADGKAAAIPGPGTLLNFDSGRHVSFADALLHSLVLGTTGSGKTRTVIIPAVRAHIEAGHSGLIVDIKGNFSDYVRSVACACGREKDIVEFGISPSAHAANILESMTVDSFHNFCMNLISKFCEGKSNNMDFHAHGASMARDSFHMLKEIAAHERGSLKGFGISPTLPLILELFNDPVEASRLFCLYVDRVADRQNAATRKFIRQVQHSRFHILNQDTKEKGSTHREQMSYATHGIIMSLKGFLDEEGIEAKFCGNCAPAIQVEELVEKGKLVLLRFGTAAGAAAAQISRLIMNDFYKTIYKVGLEKPAPRFVCVDEFQEVADLSDGKYSDANFVSLAREFGCGFLGATQSLSALVAKSSPQAVEGFVSNCNQKIFLYSEDPLTREAARRYDPNVELIDLKTDQVFAATYDAEAREHRWGMDSLSWSYKSCVDLPRMSGEPYANSYPPLSLEAVCDFVNNLKKREPGEKKGANTEHVQVGEAANRRWKMKAEIEFGKKDSAETENGHSEEGRSRDEMQKIRISDFQIDFPLLFDNNAQIVVPSGWRPFVRKALELYSEMGLTDKISSLKLSHSNLVAKGSREALSRDASLEVLNNILDMANLFCMKCGKALTKIRDTALCDDCLASLGLPMDLVNKKESIQNDDI